MKKKLLIIIAIVFAVACTNSQYSGYKLTKNGLYYKIVNKNNSSQLININDFVSVNMQYRTMSDSVFFDSEKEFMPIWIPITAPNYNGDIMEGLIMLGLGDSASFIVSADTFFRKTIGTSIFPDFLKRENKMYVNLKIKEIKTMENFIDEQKIITENLKRQFDELKEKEVKDLADYLSFNNIKQKQRESGLIFIPISTTAGSKLQVGENVKLDYTGTLIDGQIFDSSEGRKPMEVVVGSVDLIEGFNEALLLMSKGDHAKAIIPSNIAFGSSDVNSPIPPYATVIFDIKVLK